jgi:hypothetical protein
MDQVWNTGIYSRKECDNARINVQRVGNYTMAPALGVRRNDYGTRDAIVVTWRDLYAWNHYASVGNYRDIGR